MRVGEQIDTSGWTSATDKMLLFGDGVSVGFAIRVRRSADEQKALRRGRVDYSVYVKEAIPYVVLGFTNGEGQGIEVIGHGNWWKSSAEERARLSVEPVSVEPVAVEGIAVERVAMGRETRLDSEETDIEGDSNGQEEESARVQREVLEHFRGQKKAPPDGDGRSRRSRDRFRGVTIYLLDGNGWVVGIRKESMHRHHVERVREALQAQSQRYASREEVDAVAIRTRQRTRIQEIRERAGTYRVRTA